MKRPMQASKEECRIARDGLTRLVESSPSLRSPKKFGKEIAQLFDFLQAAERKLPTEKAFEKERTRRDTPKQPYVSNSCDGLPRNVGS